MDWARMIDEIRGGREILSRLGVETDFGLPTSHNAVLEVASDPDALGEISGMAGFNRINMSKLAAICQMAIYDQCAGPETDGRGKGIRRHWYAFYKGGFAQPFSEWLGEDLQSPRWGLNWFGRLSETYAWLVDVTGATYQDLWIKDASRLVKPIYRQLFDGLNVLIAVEKDTLIDDFIPPAKAMGAKAVYSGKGKSSKAAIEKVLRDHFGWSDHDDPFSDDSPLIVLHVSDYDYDGEAVIGPTFAEQARRYTPHILEARVGIKPGQLWDAGIDPTTKEHQDKWYKVKTKNSVSTAWAERKAFFAAECSGCSHVWPAMGIEGGPCPRCGNLSVIVDIKQNPPHGFEVEALMMRSYYGVIIDALLQVLPFDQIVENLRDECVADPYAASHQVAQEKVYSQSESYRQLLAEFKRLEKIKERFEYRVEGHLSRIASPMSNSWRDEEDDPTPQQFQTHVQKADDWSDPWRPFSRELRTEKLTSWLRNQDENGIASFTNEHIEF